ncbi:MAG: hypothetical protein ACRBBR_06910 [Cellvibrionaceae bacterium]
MKITLVFLTFTLSLLSQVAFASVYITYPEKTEAYKKIAEKIKENLQKNNIKETFILKNEELKEKKIKENDLTIFLGNQKKETRKNKNPSIFSFTNSKEEKEIKNWSIISTNQTAKRLLYTARKTVKKEYKKNILFVLSEENKWAIKQLKNINDIRIIIVKKNEIAAKKIEPELDETAAIVALYDKTIWSGNSARWILQTAYNHKVPIIGYSKSFLKAGAVASVYSSADQIIKEIEKHVLQWSKTGKLNNNINYPEYTIEVNNNIAKALNLSSMKIIELGKKQ